MTSTSRSQYFADQYNRNQIVRDLLRGLKGLRGFDSARSNSSQSIYLPPYPKEPESFYNLRLERSYLTNYFVRTLKSDAGKILDNGVYVKEDGEDVDELFNVEFQDMDLDGKNLLNLTHDQLTSAQAKGISLAVVDYSGYAGRAYVREVDIDDVVEFKANKDSGRIEYIKFAIEIDSEDEENETELITAYYELRPEEWRIVTELGKVYDEGSIVRYRNGSERITDEIPMSILYLNKKRTLIAESPYQTLAELNVEHFQEYSQLKNMMFYATQPILFGTNMPNDFEMTVLASYMFVNMPENTDTTPEMKWVQVDATPLEQSRKMLQDIESRISQFGIDTQETRTGAITATEKAIDSAGSNATLNDFAIALSQHIERIIQIMSTYSLGEQKDIDVSITPDVSITDDDKKVTHIIRLRELKEISHDALIDSLIENKMLPEGFDKESDLEKIKEEIKEMSENNANNNPNTKTDNQENTENINQES